MDSGTQDTVLKAGIGIGAIVIVGAVAYKFLGSVSGPPGGACNDPSSPCFQALAPLQQEFATCAAQYKTTFAQFVAEDSANGTGITAPQQSVLDNLTACMGTAAKSIASVAQGYGVNGLDTFLSYVGVGGAGLLALVGLGKFAQYYKTTPSTGAGAASLISDATVQDAADTGAITAESASVFSSQVQSTTQDLIAADGQALDEYVAAGILTAEDAATIAAADASSFEADAQTVIDSLTGLLGYSPLNYGPEFDVPTADYDADRFQGNPAFSWGPITDVPATGYDPDAFGYGPGGPGMVFATPAVDDCGCHGGLRFGRGNLWMLRKKG